MEPGLQGMGARPCSVPMTEEVRPVGEEATPKLETLCDLYVVVPSDNAADIKAVGPTSTRVCVVTISRFGWSLHTLGAATWGPGSGKRACGLFGSPPRRLFSPHSGWETRRRSPGGIQANKRSALLLSPLVHPLPWAQYLRRYSPPSYSLLAGTYTETDWPAQALFAGREAALKQQERGRYLPTYAISPLGHWPNGS